MRKRCFVGNCGRAATQLTWVHGAFEGEAAEYATCGYRPHVVKAQRALRSRLRRERGVAQPGKNKAARRSGFKAVKRVARRRL